MIDQINHSMATISKVVCELASLRERVRGIENKLTYFPDSPEKQAALKRLRTFKEGINPRIERAVLLVSRFGMDKARIAAKFEIGLDEVGAILRREGIFR